MYNLSNAACCVQPRDYGCPPNDIDEDFLNEIEDGGQTFISIQPRRGLVTKQTQIQFTQIQSQKGKWNYPPDKSIEQQFTAWKHGLWKWKGRNTTRNQKTT